MPDGTGYEDDFYLWTAEQARRLRTGQGGSNLTVDWENVAEEIESLGRSDRREVRSRTCTILEHLLKLQFSQATVPRAGWIRTVSTQRHDLALVLDDSPSLRAEVGKLSRDELAFAQDAAAASLDDHGELDAAAQVRAGGGSDLPGRVLDATFIPHPPVPATSESA